MYYASRQCLKAHSSVNGLFMMSQRAQNVIDTFFRLMIKTSSEDKKKHVNLMLKVAVF